MPSVEEGGMGGIILLRLRGEQGNRNGLYMHRHRLNGKMKGLRRCLGRIPSLREPSLQKGFRGPNELSTCNFSWRKGKVCLSRGNKYPARKVQQTSR